MDKTHSAIENMYNQYNSQVASKSQVVQETDHLEDTEDLGELELSVMKELYPEMDAAAIEQLVAVEDQFNRSAGMFTISICFIFH